MAGSAVRRAARTSGARPEWAKGARNAIAIAVPVAIGSAAGYPEIGATAGLGAYLVAFADDKGGAFNPRLKTMSLCMVWCAVAFLIGFSVSSNVWVSAIVIAAATLVWGFLAAAGPVASVIGSMAATATLFATESAGASGLAMTAALIAGGLLIIGLTAAAIPFAKERPAQTQLESAIDCTRRVVLTCATASDDDNQQARDKAQAAIVAARAVAEQSFRRGDPRTDDRFAVLRSCERFLKFAAAERFSSRAVRRGSDPQAAAQSARRVAELLVDFDAMLAHPPQSVDERNDEPFINRSSLWDRLRPALRPESDGFAYAVRFTVVAAIGLLIAALSHVPHSGWITVTSWRALRPTYAVTITRAQQRLYGTIVGGVLASASLLWVPDGRAQAVVVGIFAFLCFSIRAVNYGFYVVFATVVILTLISLDKPTDLTVALVRVGATALGVALAVAGARWILPRWTNTQARARCAASLQASAAYLATIRDSHRDRYDTEQVTAARRKCEAANSSAYSTFDQMSMEPTTTANELELIGDAVAVSAFVRDGLIASATSFVADRTARVEAIAVLDSLDERLRATVTALEDVDPASATQVESMLTEVEASAEACFTITVKKSARGDA